MVSEISKAGSLLVAKKSHSSTNVSQHKLACIFVFVFVSLLLLLFVVRAEGDHSNFSLELGY